jgi:hypothetical protein
MAVPLSQLAPIDPDESTEEATDHWHYWIPKGICSEPTGFTQAYRKCTLQRRAPYRAQGSS